MFFKIVLYSVQRLPKRLVRGRYKKMLGKKKAGTVNSLVKNRATAEEKKLKQ